MNISKTVIGPEGFQIRCLTDLIGNTNEKTTWQNLGVIFPQDYNVIFPV